MNQEIANSVLGACSAALRGDGGPGGSVGGAGVDGCEVSGGRTREPRRLRGVVPVGGAMGAGNGEDKQLGSVNTKN